MSFIHVPDPDIGRCQNVRHVTHGDGYMETLRCLDYEGMPHVCEFPKARHVVSSGSHSMTYSPPKPRRWVKPPKEPA